MALIDNIRNDLKQSMLKREKLKISTLRLCISAIKNKEIEKGEILSDEEVVGVLGAEVKKRRESVNEYKKANRAELAEKEQKEIEIIKKYLPKQLSDEELQSLVKEAIAQSGAQSKKDMGRVMQQLIPKIKGRADGRKASDLVIKELEG